MKTGWIVIINKGIKLLKYIDRYKVFLEENKQSAINWAKQNGYCDPFEMGIDEKIGMANVYSDIDIDILIMRVEIK